jgi:hypothetical protein
MPNERLRGIKQINSVPSLNYCSQDMLGSTTSREDGSDEALFVAICRTNLKSERSRTSTGREYVADSTRRLPSLWSVDLGSSLKIHSGAVCDLPILHWGSAEDICESPRV